MQSVFFITFTVVSSHTAGLINVCSVHLNVCRVCNVNICILKQVCVLIEVLCPINCVKFRLRG